MEYCELPAPPPLDALVHCFWFLRGEGGAEAQTIVADGRIEIVLHLADTFSRVDAAGVAHRQDTSLVGGQLTAPFRLRAGACADVVGIRFRTATAGALLGAPLAELTNRVESLGSVAPRLSEALTSAAAQHRDPHARVAALSAALIKFVRAEPDPLALHAAHALEFEEANRVGELARQSGVSSRTVERRVLESTGLSPSALRRVLRFRRAFRLLDRAPAGAWGRVAAGAGYFDQAHLIREFRRFAGATPSEFFGGNPALATALANSSEPAA